ncbi:MAG: hypothetical protein H7177_14805 [Rhizobacter sp.]|nr:hypothetical protein [Bacteriovorax sp.]
MKRYIFLLLAFFLSFNAHADGLGISSSMGSMNISPSGLSSVEADALKAGQKKKHPVRYVVAYNSNGVTNIKDNSSRNINELGNINESTEISQRPSLTIPLDRQTNGVPNLGTRKGKTALSNVSCKTYEGKIYDQGEAGYNDCIRTIKTDRQKDTSIP